MMSNDQGSVTGDGSGPKTTPIDQPPVHEGLIVRNALFYLQSWADDIAANDEVVDSAKEVIDEIALAISMLPSFQTAFPNGVLIHDPYFNMLRRADVDMTRLPSVEDQRKVTESFSLDELAELVITTSDGLEVKLAKYFAGNKEERFSRPVHASSGGTLGSAGAGTGFFDSEVDPTTGVGTQTSFDARRMGRSKRVRGDQYKQFASAVTDELNKDDLFRQAGLLCDDKTRKPRDRVVSGPRRSPRTSERSESNSEFESPVPVSIDNMVGPELEILLSSGRTIKVKLPHPGARVLDAAPVVAASLRMNDFDAVFSQMLACPLDTDVADPILRGARFGVPQTRHGLPGLYDETWPEHHLHSTIAVFSAGTVRPDHKFVRIDPPKRAQWVLADMTSPGGKPSFLSPSKNNEVATCIDRSGIIVIMRDAVEGFRNPMARAFFAKVGDQLGIPQDPDERVRAVETVFALEALILDELGIQQVPQRDARAFEGENVWRLRAITQDLGLVGADHDMVRYFVSETAAKSPVYLVSEVFASVIGGAELTEGYKALYDVLVAAGLDVDSLRKAAIASDRRTDCMLASEDLGADVGVEQIRDYEQSVSSTPGEV